MSMRHINVKEPPTMAGKLPLLTSTPMMRKNMSPPSRQFQIKPQKGTKEKLLTDVNNKDINSLIQSLTQLRRWILTQPGMIDGSIVLGATVDLLSEVKVEREMMSKKRSSNAKKIEEDEEYEKWMEGNNLFAAELDSHLGALKKEKMNMASSRANLPPASSSAGKESNGESFSVDENSGFLRLNPDAAAKYRKKLVVYAFPSDDPVLVEKSWGHSQGVKGDWVIAGEKGDLYTCPNELFMKTYEPSAGGPHRYQKKGFVYAQQMLKDFKARTKDGYQEGKAGDYLLQDPAGEQWTMTNENFQKTYEPAILSRHTRMLDGILAFSEGDEGEEAKIESLNDPLTIEVQSLLNDIDSQTFQIFKLTELTDHHPLTALATFIFQKRKLIDYFNISMETFTAFINEVEGTYHDNPYHNSTHAADVLHSCNYIISHTILERKLDMKSKFAILVGASCHDIGHPGTNNAFQIKARSSLALCYNDRMVLENFHCATSFHILRKKEFNILPDTSDHYSYVRTSMIEMILATDLAVHKQYIQKFDTLYDELSNNANGADPDQVSICDTNYPEDAEKQLMLLVAVIKCADIGHPWKDLDAHIKWSKLCNDEFAFQSQQETLIGIPVSFDPNISSIESKFCQSQIGFVKARCTNRLIGIKNIMTQLEFVLNYWQEKLKNAPPAPST